MATKKVSDASFEADVLKNSLPVVVDFWAEWCGPCRMVGPSLEEIAAEMDGKVVVAKVNIDDNPEWASKFNVRSIPMMMVFKDGEVVSTKLGADSKSNLSRWISSAVGA